MTNQMVTFLSSMALPEPGQIFTVGFMTWIIGLKDNGEIVEVVQDHPAPITPTPATASPIPAPHRWVTGSINNDDLIASIDRVTNRLTECQLLVDSVLDQCRASDDFPALQDHQAATTERPARPLHSRWPDSDMVITATPEGRTIQLQPLPAPTESMPKPYSFGLVGAGLICQDAVHHLFADHAERSRVDNLYQIDSLEADQPAPMVNMVQIRIDLPDDTLQTILEESPEPYSEGSTSTCPPFPPGFGRSSSWLATIALLSMERLVSSA